VVEPYPPEERQKILRSPLPLPMREQKSKSKEKNYRVKSKNIFEF